MTEIEKLKETTEIRAKLIGSVAHSLRTTMTNIRWTLELFLDGDLGPLSAEQKDYLEKLNNQTESATRLLSELLNIIHAEEMELKEEKLEEIDLVSLIQKIISQFSEVAKKKNIKIKFESPALPQIKTSQKKVEFIVSNLLDNALRYSDRGAITVKTEKKVKALEISVKDEGIGIPEADQGKVFEKFFRSENAKAKERLGTGLGLHITRELVEGLGGKIWFESKIGAGTTFYFTLLLP